MKLHRQFEAMLFDVLDAMIQRYERDPDYPFIDTKLDLCTGADFGTDAEWFRRRDIIYPWIQGRGLEALSGHLKVLALAVMPDAAAKRRYKRKITKMIAEITDRMEKMRRRNHGRLFFMMSPDGEMLVPGDDGPVPLKRLPHESNFSDLFYSKGLFAAGVALRHRRYLRHGENYLRRTVRAILAEKFITDQQNFDPKNPVAAVPGKLLQGPKMIALDGTAIGIAAGDSTYWERRALNLLDRIFGRYINADERIEHLARYDFWEAVGNDFAPYIESSRLLADPGHALEFIGLSLKNLLQFASPAGKRRATALREIYPDMLRHYFAIGYAPQPGGIVKSFDLIARRPLNTDMPWWSLPETIRAATLAVEFTGDESLADIAVKCSRDFLEKYVNPDCHSMAYQTRDAQGKVVQVIPATPDADPGYHTGLSIIDALPTLKRLNL